jgi:hypothetical protein
MTFAQNEKITLIPSSAKWWKAVVTKYTQGVSRIVTATVWGDLKGLYLNWIMLKA